MITIQVYDQGAILNVEKAILQSNLGLNPSREGSLVRVVIPSLTEERRKELVKTLHKVGEETKVSVRNHRRGVLDDLKKALKDKKISEDDNKRGGEKIQKITDKAIKDIDVIIAEKEKEMMEI